LSRLSRAVVVGLLCTMLAHSVSGGAAPAQDARPITGGPRWSPDGENIVYVRKVGVGAGNEIWTMDRDGQNQRQVFAGEGIGGTPAYSPSGDQIVFDAVVDGATDLFVMNADGRGRRQLTETPVDERMPEWSRDGSRVYFSVRPPEQGPSKVYRVNVDGSQRTLVSGENWSDIYPRPAPVGNALLTTGRRVNGPFNQILMRADETAEPVDLTDRATPNYNAAWSPDGKRIVFVSHVDESYAGLFMMNADGGELEQLTEYVQGSYGPKWSPDGRLIVFRIGWDNDHAGLFTIDIESRSVKQLTNAKYGGPRAADDPESPAAASSGR
jgi:Tol biopolymer transport system component